MIMFGALVAFDRETLMLGALGSLILAGVVVSITAWILLAGERRRGRAPKERVAPIEPDEGHPAPEAQPE
ncbi:MAG TPA: hypothetical protein VEN82_04940 [Actinomycetota bacterium]|nr:hypothetical protein [Actinomycetota bacterium]